MKQDLEARVATLTEMVNSEREWRKNRRKERLLRPWVCSIFAAFGIFGGISALFVGIVSVVIHGIVSSDRNFGQVGTALLIVAIPMILVGSIFLDEIEERKS